MKVVVGKKKDERSSTETSLIIYKYSIQYHVAYDYNFHRHLIQNLKSRIVFMFCISRQNYTRDFKSTE